MKLTITLILTLFINIAAFAQGSYSIGGTVKNAKGERMPSATVFIAGSQKATATNANGEFNFGGIAPGTYEIVVKMLGYDPLKQNVIVKDGPASLSLVLVQKNIMLDNVVIGGKSKQDDHLKIFIRKLMGTSANAKSCKILNPEIVDFSTNKGILKATTEDFLMIENKNLGYRISYLLRDFQYNKETNITAYNGDAVFEPMAGTPEEEKQWELNRAKVYEGSLLHYLRSIYSNTSREEGFLTYLVMNPNYPILIGPNPVYPLQLIKKVDSNFVTFTYKKRLYVEYDKKKAAKSDKLSDESFVQIDMASKGSVFMMMNGLVDKRGSFASTGSAWLEGYWDELRLGDDLPIEYVHVPQKNKDLRSETTNN